jgi:hypothetical protein
MPLVPDPILGVCYLSPNDFLARVAAFGGGQAVAALTPTAITALLATASRQIEVYLGGLTFTGAEVTEHQPWNPRTRRFPLNNPPPSEVTACKLWVAPGLHQGIGLTPVVNDEADVPVSWGQLLWNRQVRLMEIGLLAGTTLAAPVITIAGLTHPFIEITYRGAASVPEEVAAACGFQAGWLAQQSVAGDLLPGDVSSVRTHNRQITRNPKPATASGTFELCEMAKSLLQGHVCLAAG